MGIKSTNRVESYYNYFAESGKDAVTPKPGPFEATGGFLNDYESGGQWYRSHIFLNPGTFEVPSEVQPGTCDYLVIGGGGGGGNCNGGGGGAGTVLYGEGFAATAGDHLVQVGQGGCGANKGQEGVPTSQIYDGGPSKFTPTYEAPGGSGGGNGNNPGAWNAGRPGGSAGGGGTNPDGAPNAPGTAPGTYPGSGPKVGTWGGNGGSGSPPVGNGGGGGGAGGNGYNHNSGTYRGGGGPGITFAAGDILGIELNVAGGGGGGGPAPGGTSGGSIQDNPGATDAGAAGGISNNSGGTPGGAATKFGTGSGGGGGAAWPGSAGGNAAPGMVIVRYAIGNPGTVAKATGGLITYAGGKTIHSFLWPGTFATQPTWSTTNVEYVCVAGGGCGGAEGTHAPSVGGQAGGGGAGGFRTNVPGVTTSDPTVPLTGAAVPVGSSSFGVTVGRGGYGAEYVSQSAKGNGTDSTIAFPGGTITATGGGQGGGIDGGGEAPGGSGGGSGDSNSDPTSVGAPGNNPPFSPVQGHAGGNAPGYSGAYSGGGGGGAGAVGGTGGATPAAGGAGAECSITGSPVYYAGGGGGGNNSANGWPGEGGAGNLHGVGVGGKTPGPPSGPSPGTPWLQNGPAGWSGPGGHGTSGAGGGGGGTRYSAPAETHGGNGGSGIVIIAYPS